MAASNLKSVLPKVLRLENVARRATPPLATRFQRRSVTGEAGSSKDDDKPVAYSTSKAATWKAEQSFRSPNYDKIPEAQRWSVLASLSAFLLYFLVLREENDFDEYLARPLTETVPDIEKVTGKLQPPPPEWVPPAWRS